MYNRRLKTERTAFPKLHNVNISETSEFKRQAIAFQAQNLLILRQGIKSEQAIIYKI